MKATKQVPLSLIILALTAFMSLTIRLLSNYNWDKSALLYVGIPFVIAAALCLIPLPKPDGRWKWRYINLVVVSMIIFLASSVILFEGFICVIMFMPLYFGVILIVFLIHFLTHKYKHRKTGQLFSHVLPLLIIISAFEGTHQSLSFERKQQAMVSKIIPANIDAIHHKLSQPVILDKERHWFLSMFPMPHTVVSGSMEPGAIHETHLTYHRWFITNTHSGKIVFKIDESSRNQITTNFVEDSSYLSTYLKFNRSEINLLPIDDENTQVTFIIEYERLLDPAWYFHPLQKYGVQKGAEFLFAEVLTPDNRMHENDE